MAAGTPPPQQQLPFVDDLTVKDIFADSCAGVSVANGNFHMTFAVVTADYTKDPVPATRKVCARLVIPISGAIEVRNILTRTLDVLTAQDALGPSSAAPEAPAATP